MNEDALRVLVRQTLSRLESRDGADAHVSHPVASQPLHVADPGHTSHYRYTLQPSGGPCFIEPGVPCNHCGYCQSHGH